MAVGKNTTLKKGKGKQYYLPFNIETAWKNIMWERGRGTEIQDLKKKWG